MCIIFSISDINANDLASGRSFYYVYMDFCFRTVLVVEEKREEKQKEKWKEEQGEG